jgi:hypothetical protein
MFRSDQKFIFRELDYPLNAGGSLGIVRKDLNSESCRLDLESIGEYRESCRGRSSALICEE